VFLLGVLTRRANQRGAMVGMACGFAVELYLWLATRVPWTWWVMTGSTVTFAVGLVVSAIVEESSPNGRDRLPG
jgi:solute:Na+ symporter, SSS family